LTVDFNTSNPPPSNNYTTDANGAATGPVIYTGLPGGTTWAGLTGSATGGPGGGPTANRVPNGSVVCGQAFVIYKDLDASLFNSRFYRCIFFSQ